MRILENLKIVTQTKLLFVKRHLGQITTDDYVEWAITCLENGVELKSVGILAATEAKDFPSEIGERFERALHEMRIEIPNKRSVLLWYVQKIANEIVSGKIGEAQGCSNIYSVWRSVEYDFNEEIRLSELINWVYLDEGMDPVTYEWLSDPSTYPTIPSKRWFEAIRDEARKLMELHV